MSAGSLPCAAASPGSPRARQTKRPWTAAECAIVREFYPIGGSRACVRRLDRSSRSIFVKAHELGVRAPGYDKPRTHWENDPDIDAAIRRAHERPMKKGSMRALAEQVRRPRWFVSRRARELGLKMPRFKEKPWTEREIELLHETAHITTGNARQHFLRAGFNRSETAIQVRRKRESISVTMARQDAGLYTANQIADLFGVDGKTVLRWISMQELRAKRRGTERLDIQGGDMWQISEKDLREFIVTYPLRVELRKIPDSNRVWFIGLLAGRAGVSAEQAVRDAA